MKRPRYIDFVCEACQHTEERFVETNEDGSIIEKQLCQNLVDERHCGWEMKPQDIGFGFAQVINENNKDFHARNVERLKQRSNEHFKKKGYEEKMDRISTWKNKMKRDA